MVGRKPKPLAQRVAEGDASKVGKKKLDALAKSEVKSERGYGPAPGNLDGEARKLWNVLVPQLEIMGVDRRPDSAALACACYSYGTAYRLTETVKKDGDMVEEKAWDRDMEEYVVLSRKPHPALSMIAKYMALYRQFCSEFGITPTARIRLSVTDKDKGSAASELAAILSRPRAPRPTGPFVVPPDPNVPNVPTTPQADLVAVDPTGTDDE